MNYLARKPDEHCGHLICNSFCIVWFHAFSIDYAAPMNSLQADEYLRPYTSTLDEQIFDHHFLDRNLIKRYQIEGFDISIQISEEDSSPVVSGRIHVEATLYFDSTFTITYRLTVGNFLNSCHASRKLSSDHIIMLAGMPLGVEHWHATEEGGKNTSTIDFKVFRCFVHNLRLDREGAIIAEPVNLDGADEVLHEVFSRYRAFLCRKSLSKSAGSISHDSTYVLIDIWEDIEHSEGGGVNFSKMSAPEIIRHIESEHKAELIGILTLYPFEWPYRDERCFSRVCGDNVAIDTDDLVLVSENAAIIIGTYGLRGKGSPVDWQKVLTRRSTDHVCWPEYLHILDIIIAKLHAVRVAFYELHSAPGDARYQGIRDNSMLTIKISKILVDLNAVNFSRYASHKLMYKMTQERLDIDREMSILSEALGKIDTSMKTIHEMDELRRSLFIRILLAFITIASIFQVIFEPIEIPLLKHLAGRELAENVGLVIILFISVGLVAISSFGAIHLILGIRPVRAIFFRAKEWIQKNFGGSSRL
jgi:hypothetical protein